MNKAYEIAMANSCPCQQKNEFLIPTSNLKEVVEIPLGFQPLGIATYCDKDSRCWVAIADYFNPDILLAEVTFNDQGLKFVGEWIQKVNYRKESVRIFPDILENSEANRMQSVLIFSATKLGAIRSGERAIHILKKKNDKWCYEYKIILPEVEELYSIHSALLDRNHSALLGRNGFLYTIESDETDKRWFKCSYSFNSVEKNFDFISISKEIDRFTYGIAECHKEFFLITDPRCKSESSAILDQNFFFGNGLCILPNVNGGLLITSYGQAYPGLFKGQPGKLIFLPFKKFKQK